MRNLLILLFTLIIFSSCDSRKDDFQTINDAPFFTSFEGDSISLLSDSVKTSTSNYSLPIRLEDPNENLSSLLFFVTSGGGSLMLNGSPVNTSISLKNLSSYNLVFDPSSNGEHFFDITIIDKLDASSMLSVELVSFDNLSPIAIVDITKPANSGPFERLIDASESFDGDAKFGGAISSYEYTFLGILVESDDPTQTVIFPSAGTYQLTIRVQDNDDEWSDMIVINQSIE